MSSKFPLDARKVCAYLCIYECAKSQILAWIKEHQLKKDKEDLAGKLAAIKDACGEADLAVCAALKSGAKAAAKRAGELGEAQMVKFDAAADKIAVKYKKELMSLADIAKSL